MQGYWSVYFFPTQDSSLRYSLLWSSLLGWPKLSDLHRCFKFCLHHSCFLLFIFDRHNHLINFCTPNSSQYLLLRGPNWHTSFRWYHQNGKRENFKILSFKPMASELWTLLGKRDHKHPQLSLYIVLWLPKLVYMLWMGSSKIPLASETSNHNHLVEPLELIKYMASKKPKRGLVLLSVRRHRNWLEKDFHLNSKMGCLERY